MNESAYHVDASCQRSPELIFDRTRDYILYAVDPIESHRATQKRRALADSSNSRTNAQEGPSSTRANDEHQQSPSKMAARSSFLVGKGLFSWALAEQGDGESSVVGRVCSEHAHEDEDEDEDRDREDDDDEDEDEGRILEVNIRLKEAPSISRDQYFDRVRAFQSATTKGRSETRKEGRKDKTKGSKGDTNSSTPSMSSPPPSSPLASTSSALEQMRKIASRSSTPAAPGGASAQQQLLQLLQALQAQGQSPRDAPKSQATHAPASAAASVPVAAATAAAAAASTPNAPPSQDLMSQLLQSLMGAGSSNSSTFAPPSQQQQPSREATTTVKKHRPPAAVHAASSPQLGTVSLPARRKSLSTGPPRAASVSDAASPILGGLTPGYETGYVSGPSPAASTSAMPKVEKAPEVAVAKEGSERERQCCYNCGLRAQPVWRIVMLPDEEVRFRDGSEHWHESSKFYRACNACGLYFNRYNGISRPEHVWKEAIRASKRKDKRKVGEEDGEESTTSPIDGELDDDESADELLLPGGLKKSFSRTLSEACQRDSERLASVDGETPAIRAARRKQVEAVKATSWDKARLKDFVMDQDGNWRTKRSVKENPGGRRPGRPKGSKTGKGAGRTRNQIYAERRARQQMMMANEAAAQNAMAEASSRPMLPQKRATFAAQSSPVRPSKAARTASASGTIPSAGMGLTPGTSPGYRSRYGAAGYLLDSSPATAFQTVLSEAETDWNSLYGILGQTPRRSPRKNPHGTMSGLNPYASTAQAPASPSSGRGKGSAMDHSAGVAPLDLMAMTSSSPLTRGRVRSGQFTLGDAALWTSSDGLQGSKTSGNGSSSITSPGSPSPSPARLYSKLVKGKAAGAALSSASKSSSRGVLHNQLMAGAMSIDDLQMQASWGAASSPSRARKAARQARNAPPGSSSTSQQQQQSKSDGVLDAGPFMGLSVLETEDDDGMNNFVGNASPTLGRSLRRKGHTSKMPIPDLELPPPSARTSPTVDFDFSTGNSGVTVPSSTEAASSGAGVKVEASSVMNHNDEYDFTDWTQSSSMRELFPTPSPVKGWTNGGSAAQSGEQTKGETSPDPTASLWSDSPNATAAAAIASAAAAAAAAVAPDTQMPTAPKEVTVTAEPALSSGVDKDKQDFPKAESSQENGAKTEEKAEPPQDQHLQIIRHRKPLPATVEDASPSASSAIGANDDPIFGSDDDEDDEEDELEGEGNQATTLEKLMEMFEDPYGLLAASGIGGANRIEQQGQTSTAVETTTTTAGATAAATTSTAGDQAPAPEVSFDHLEAIELFQSMDFAKQFDFFTQAGSTGIAAHHVIEPAEESSSSEGAAGAASSSVKQVTNSHQEAV